MRVDMKNCLFVTGIALSLAVGLSFDASGVEKLKGASHGLAGTPSEQTDLAWYRQGEKFDGRDDYVVDALVTPRTGETVLTVGGKGADICGFSSAFSSGDIFSGDNVSRS